MSEKAYALSSAYLKESPLQDREYNKESIRDQDTLRAQLKTIDVWLEHIESHVLCRKLTLSVIGDGIRKIIDFVQQKPIPETISSSRHGLEGKLEHFLEAIEKPDSFNYLYTVGWPSSVRPPMKIKRDISEGLTKVRDLWQRGEPSPGDEVSGSEDRADRGQEYESRTWKLPGTAHYQLDDIIIYRAVLMTLLYSLSSDNSVLLDQDSNGLIVPIM